MQPILVTRDKDFSKEKKIEKFAENLYEVLTNKETLIPIIYLMEEKELSIVELKEKLLKISPKKNKKINTENVKKMLEKMEKLNLLTSKLKRKSALRRYYKLSKDALKIIDSYLGINDRNITKWVGYVKRGNLEEIIEGKFGIV